MAKTAGNVVENFDSAEWETVAEASGTPVEFKNVGDSFTGVLQNKELIKFTDPKEGDQEFWKYTFTDSNGELRAINGAYKIDLGMQAVELGKLVRITFTGLVPTGMPSPMKDYRVEVAK